MRRERASESVRMCVCERETTSAIVRVLIGERERYRLLRYIHKVYIVLTKKKIVEGGEGERRTVINRVPPGRSVDDANNIL